MPILPSTDEEAPPAVASEVRALGGTDDRCASDLDPDLDSTGPATMPTGGWERMVLVLSETALQHVARRELDDARRAATDALLLLESVHDPRALADASLRLVEVLLELSEAHRAHERFVTASNAFGALGDTLSAARAVVGLARALVHLGDPTAQAAFEDAGTLYEEIGDEDAVLAIAAELREATLMFAESPLRIVPDRNKLAR